MSDQKKSMYLQDTSSTNSKINNEESRKNSVVDELKPEDKMSIDSKSKQHEGTDNRETDEVDGTEPTPEDKVTCDKTSKQEDRTDNKKSGRIEGELKPEHNICIDKISRKDDGPPPAIKINNINNEFGEGNNEMVHEDETLINNIDDSDEDSGGMWSYKHRILANTVNSRKRDQNQSESLHDNQNCLMKKIKVEDTSNDFFDSMWQYLECDPSNFDAWVSLLKLVDDENIKKNARLVYPKFLELFPLCYGYWKKYANFEKRNNNISKERKVLAAGLKAIPISVDLWINYMQCLMNQYSNEEHYIRSEFEKCLGMCGLHYYSDRLWKDYITWEMERNEVSNAANIYYRFLRIPTSNCVKNFFKFQEFIFKISPEECLDFPELVRRKSIIIRSFKRNQNIQLNRDTLPPGEDLQQETNITKESYMDALRVDIIDEWHNVHQKTLTEYENRKIFEENIQRHHFHVNDLEPAQITNWQNYIEFEKKYGNHERIIFLYERCLIACTSNVGFWVDYLDYLCLSNCNDTDSIFDVFKRSLFHHPKSFPLNLKYFDFAETCGSEEIATETIKHLETINPDSEEVIVRLLNLARKKQDGTIGILYNYYLNRSQSKAFSSFIAVKYARFVWKHDRQLDLALDILHNTIDNKNIKINDSLEMYLTLVELKMELNPKDHLLILKTIDAIITQCKSYKDKLVFSKKKLEYAEDYIQDYDVLRLAKIENKNFKDAFLIERK